MDARKEDSDPRSAGRRRIVWGVLVVMALVVVALVGEMFVFQVVTVSSNAMRPTLLSGDSVLVDRLAYDLASPQRGDIIAFWFPRAPWREFVKRIIGLPGDIVAERAGRFWVNGIPVVRLVGFPSARDVTPPVNMSPRRVPAGRFYVLGDNRNASLDSRYWGAVSEDDVIGKAFLIPWSEGRHWWDVRWSRVGRWLH